MRSGTTVGCCSTDYCYIRVGSASSVFLAAATASFPVVPVALSVRLFAVAGGERSELMPKRKANRFPVRFRPAELMASVPPGVGDGAGSLHASLLGGGCRSGIVERNLLSLFKGDSDTKLQVTNARPEPSLAAALSLRVGPQEDPQPQKRRVNAAIRGHDDPSHLSLGRSSSGSGHVPQQPAQAAAGSLATPLPPSRPPSARGRAFIGLGHAPTQQIPNLLPAGSGAPTQVYARCSPPAAGVGLAPQLLHPSALGAAPPQPHCGACKLHCRRLVEAADWLKNLSEFLRLHAAAAGFVSPAFSAGSPQPCGGAGGAWRRCAACGARPGTVALKPYEHLCLCARCSDASRDDPSIACLHCSISWTGAVEAASRGLPSWP